MKKTRFFVLATGILSLMLLPVFASAQSYYSSYPYYNQDYYPYSSNRDYSYNRYYDHDYRYYDGRYYDDDDDVFCTPQNQTVREGERAHFVAFGGDGDYDWRADGRTFRDEGRRFSFVFDDDGTETVRVTSDGESDTCRVRVVERDYYYPYGGYNYPTYPTYPTYTAPTTYTYTQPVAAASTYVPQALPNTGFPPISSAAIAFTIVLLGAAGLVLMPYARKVATAWR